MSEDVFARQNLALHARSQLYGVCWDELIDQMQAHGAALTQPLRDLRRSTEEIVGKYKGLVEEQGSHYKRRVGEAAAEIETAAKETTEMLEGAEEMERQFREREEALKADWDRERRQLLQELAAAKSGQPSGTVSVRALSPHTSQMAASPDHFS